MVRAQCGWEERREIDVSIAGSSRPYEYTETTRWKGGCYSSKESEEFMARFPVRIKGENSQGKPGYIGWVSGTARLHYLSDLYLRLHITSKDEDVVEEIYNALLYPRYYPSLGRREDLLRIDKIRVIDVSEEIEMRESDMRAWTPVELQPHAFGTVFTLHKDWEIVKDRRVFENRKVYLSGKYSFVNCQIDSEDDPVFFV